MSNYAPALARDKGGEPLQDAPAPKLALATYASENSTASSVISVTHDTTALEISAVGGAAVMKWITTGSTNPSVISIAGGTANFDHVIPTATYRKFVIPIEARSAGAQGASAVGINRGEGLYQRVAIKSIGVASVLVTEYGF